MRSIAWILLLKRILVSRQVLRGPLIVEELQAAKVAVCKLVQKEALFW